MFMMQSSDGAGAPAASHCSFQATPSVCTKLTMPVARFFQRGGAPRLATAWSCQSEAKSGASFNHSLENLVSHELSLSLALRHSRVKMLKRHREVRPHPIAPFLHCVRIVRCTTR